MVDPYSFQHSVGSTPNSRSMWILVSIRMIPPLISVAAQGYIVTRNSRWQLFVAILFDLVARSTPYSHTEPSSLTQLHRPNRLQICARDTK